VESFPTCLRARKGSTAKERRNRNADEHANSLCRHPRSPAWDHRETSVTSTSRSKHNFFRIAECSSVGEEYFIYDPDTGKQAFEPDSPDWFSWLAGRTSFHFKGKDGHFTARHEEKKKRDEGETSLSYWYAYRKAYGKQHKRYLGATDVLTLAKLEEVAGELQTAALGSLPDDQVLNAYVQRSKPAPQGLMLGPVMFLWHDELLKVQTPTGTEYLLFGCLPLFPTPILLSLLDIRVCLFHNDL